MPVSESGVEAMAPAESAAIADWQSSLKQEVRIEVQRVAGHPALAAFDAFSSDFKALAPRVRISRNSDSDALLPGLRLAPNLIFHAVPRGTELPAFLDALAMTADPSAPARLSVDGQQAVDRIATPARLDLYVSAHCPFCPTMIQRLVSLALAAPRVMLAVIDAGLFADAARACEIRSVPTLVLDDGLRWTGAVSLDEILPAIGARDPAQLGPAVFAHMIESGAAAELATMMTHAGRIFPALIDLLVHPRWSVRLGAMVTVETLAEEAPTLAAALAPALLARYPDQGATVRGDLLNVLGMLGGADLADVIAELTRDETDAEVREAAAEAIAALKPSAAPTC